MSIEIRVPALGESVTEATVGKWFKQSGESVNVDEPLVELETDKVTVEVPAPASGVLGDILVKSGSTVAVGSLLAALKEWLGQVAVTALPKSPLGEAVTYASNQWAALNIYTTDGDLAIDNNIAERAIKPFAIGRKNWLFTGSDNGGQRLAILASFTATCQQFALNPWLWLKETLTRMPITPAGHLATLLPRPTAK